jgi:taurine dioxygenase
MAPVLDIAQHPIFETFNVPTPKTTGNKFGYVPGVTPVNNQKSYKHEDLKPTFPDLKWEALEEVAYEDKGKLGHSQFKNLLAGARDVYDYSPKIGTEIEGVQLKFLSDEAKNDLAKLVATRGVVFFRNQQDFTPEDQLALGRYFGKLHKHATTGIPARGDEELHVVYNDGRSTNQEAFFAPASQWHSDVTYEIQPPAYTSLKMLETPPRGAGGDTLWTSMYAAYDSLSAPMQKYLEGLTALHSGEEQALGSKVAGRPVRREAITTEHPLVRTNPVTGFKSIFFNPGLVKAIVGIPKLESDYVIRFLTELISTKLEHQCRFTWEKDSVAIWDNRITNHSATYGFAPHRRHAIRVTTTGEKPVFDGGLSQDEEFNKANGRPQTNKDGVRLKYKRNKNGIWEIIF